MSSLRRQHPSCRTRTLTAMSKRILVFGATGYTGELIARELVALGERPVLAGRRREALDKLAAELGGLDIAVADVERQASLSALVESGDVLISTVGPFNRWGEPAVRAATEAGAVYLDTNGESGFIADVFEHHGLLARRTGAALIPSFGYDFVPGNLAGALAMADTGHKDARIDLAYYLGKGAYLPWTMSSGTRATVAGALVENTYGYRHGRIVKERGARRVRKFDVDGRLRPGVSIGTLEQYTLPRLFPTVQEVTTYLGWFGSLSRFLQCASAVNAPLLAAPPMRRAARAAVRRWVKGSTGGPSASTLDATESRFVAEAYDDRGRRLAQRQFRGPDGYRFTARLIARAAQVALSSGVQDAGALGPIEAFGMDAIRTMCGESGLVPVESPVWAVS